MREIVYERPFDQKCNSYFPIINNTRYLWFWLFDLWELFNPHLIKQQVF